MTSDIDPTPVSDALSTLVQSAQDLIDSLRAQMSTEQATIQAQLAQIAALEAQLAQKAVGIRVGARAVDIPFAQATTEIGPIRVTRLFYDTSLPAKFSYEGLPSTGLKIIVSYKTPDTNVASYVASIPAGADVEVSWHHEPEGDYTDGGKAYKAIAERQASLVAKTSGGKVSYAFIAGGFQYGSPKRNGWNGGFIPGNAQRYYLDSYQRSVLSPVDVDPSITRYRSLLATMGKQFNGFTEYGRGVVPAGGNLSPALVAARAQVYQTDANILPDWGIDVWSYWYTTDKASGDQWRLTDTASQQAWVQAVVRRFNR